MHLLPGFVLIAYAACYLVPEILLRRRSRLARGVLDSFHWQLLVPPVVIYLVGAVIFSVASWQILGLTSVLIVLVLPGVVSMAALALDPDRPLWWGLGLSGVLSVVGLLAVWVGR